MARPPRVMPVPDGELVRRLEQSHGTLGNHWRPHLEDGGCRYRDLYPAADCPWCAAERKSPWRPRTP